MRKQEKMMRYIEEHIEELILNIYRPYSQGYPYQVITFRLLSVSEMSEGSRNSEFCWRGFCSGKLLKRIKGIFAIIIHENIHKTRRATLPAEQLGTMSRNFYWSWKFQSENRTTFSEVSFSRKISCGVHKKVVFRVKTLYKPCNRMHIKNCLMNVCSSTNRFLRKSSNSSNVQLPLVPFSEK